MSPDDPRHGTPAGRHAHMRSGTEICEPCRVAHAERRRELRESRGRQPSGLCARCQNRRTESITGICRDCQAAGKAVPVDDDFALTGGQWVPRDGIMRWEAAA